MAGLHETIGSLRTIVHTILLQTKKQREEFKLEELTKLVKNLTVVLDKLVTLTNNVPVGRDCIVSSKRLAFISMKFLQVKHSGQNFAKEEDQFKKEVVQFKRTFAALSLYAEKLDQKKGISSPISNKKPTSPRARSAATAAFKTTTSPKSLSHSTSSLSNSLPVSPRVTAPAATPRTKTHIQTSSTRVSTANTTTNTMSPGSSHGFNRGISPLPQGNGRLPHVMAKIDDTPEKTGQGVSGTSPYRPPPPVRSITSGTKPISPQTQPQFFSKDLSQSLPEYQAPRSPTSLITHRQQPTLNRVQSALDANSIARRQPQIQQQPSPPVKSPRMDANAHARIRPMPRTHLQVQTQLQLPQTQPQVPPIQPNVPQTQSQVTQIQTQAHSPLGNQKNKILPRSNTDVIQRPSSNQQQLVRDHNEWDITTVPFTSTVPPLTRSTSSYTTPSYSNLNTSTSTPNLEADLTPFSGLLSELQEFGFSTDMILNSTEEELIKALESIRIGDTSSTSLTSSSQISEKEILKAQLAKLEEQYGDLDLGDMDDEELAGLLGLGMEEGLDAGVDVGGSVGSGEDAGYAAELEARLAYLEKQLLEEGLSEFNF